ncbi:MAG: response regulator [Candidatus Eisenbacteria sp.]|nr:response regulator [Candidatus Eisenbacteria bacterium]
MSSTRARDRVLFVDDEENVLQSIRRGMLEEQPIAVLVTDMRMPEMNGLDLLKIVQERFPDTVRIILTAYSQVTTLLTAINSGQVYRYLTKPWKTETEFIPAIRQAIEYHRIIVERKQMIEELKTANEVLNRRNEELSRQQSTMRELLKRGEKDIENRSAILALLTQELQPYIADVVSASSKIMAGNREAAVQAHEAEMTTLNQRGGRAARVLHTIEELLK